MDDELQGVPIELDDADGQFDRQAEEGGYRSEAIEAALDVVRRHLPAHGPR